MPQKAWSAKRKGIDGRSSMSKAQLERAVDRD